MSQEDHNSEKIHSKYSYQDKQEITDTIYSNRLTIIKKIRFDYNKTGRRYSYWINAFYGRLYC